MDYLGGSFEFGIDLAQEADYTVASATIGGKRYSVKHSSQEQAINDLNALLNEEMTQGRLVPDQG